jgi:hypothetical protein
MDYSTFDISMLYSDRTEPRQAVTSADWRAVLDDQFGTISANGQMVIIAKIALGSYTIAGGPEAWTWKDGEEVKSLTDYFNFKKFEAGSRPDNAANMDNLTLTRFIKAYVPLTLGFLAHYYKLDFTKPSKDQVAAPRGDQWSPLSAFVNCEGGAKLMYCFGFPHAEMLLYEMNPNMHASWAVIIETAVYLSNHSMIKRTDATQKMKDIAKDKLTRLAQSNTLQAEHVLAGLKKGKIEILTKKKEKGGNVLGANQRKLITGLQSTVVASQIDLNQV